jgi:hypothetical protein
MSPTEIDKALSSFNSEILSMQDVRTSEINGDSEVEFEDDHSDPGEFSFKDESWKAEEVRYYSKTAVDSSADKNFDRLLGKHFLPKGSQDISGDDGDGDEDTEDDYDDNEYNAVIPREYANHSIPQMEDEFPDPLLEKFMPDTAPEKFSYDTKVSEFLKFNFPLT